MKSVILINQSTGYLMVDIVNAYANSYDNVVLISGRIEELERKVNSDVKIMNIISYSRDSPIKRLFTWIFGTIQIFSILFFKFWKYEIVYVTNPPMSYLLSIFFRRPFSIIVYDIYPDALKNIGITEKNVIYKLWALMNILLFKRAQKIITLSVGMANLIGSQYKCNHKIKVIHNWAASESFKPLLKTENPFVIEHGLENVFSVLYSGNIGYTHNVEIIIEVAKSLSENEDICFNIIGEGQKKRYLIRKAKEYGLKSCYFYSWQNKEILPYSLASADLAIVTLNDETAVLSVPSKTYNLLAVGAPLMCIAPKESELCSLVMKYNNGRCFDKEDIRGMVEYILEIKNNNILKSSLSANSLKASKDFTFVNSIKYV